jgi:integrase
VQGKCSQNGASIAAASQEREEALEARGKQSQTDKQAAPYVFANKFGGRYLVTSLNHLHRNVSAPKVDGKRVPIFPGDFVMHSLRHTMLTRLGEAGVDAFTIMRIAGHSSVVVSQRYIHPTPRGR